MNADEKAELEEWLQDKSPAVQAAARKRPPYGCYRDSMNPRAHYVITGYGEPHDGSAVTVALAHGADSFLPGVGTAGFDPEQLTECNCGHWQQPTDEQIEAMKEHFAALERARALAPKRSTDNTQH